MFWGVAPITLNSVTTLTFDGLILNQTPSGVQIFPSDAIGAQLTNLITGTRMYLKNYKMTQVGCILDLDFGVGCGTVIPDRSGRYHADLSGAYTHGLGKCSTSGTPVNPLVATDPWEKTTGGGYTYRNLRMVVVMRTFNNGDIKDITHKLGVDSHLSVDFWEVPPTGPKIKMELGVQAKDADTITVSADNLSGPKDVKIVMIG